MSTTRSVIRRTVAGILPLAILASAAGCGADFDSADKVNTLRVFAVQKDPPYALPTTDLANPSLVNLTMLWHPGPNHKTSEIQRLWFSGCDDLPGDQYFSCLVRMFALWKLRDKTVWKDGEVWSPLDTARAIPDDQARLAFEQGLVQQVRPDLSQDEFESYLNSVRIAAGSTFQYPIPPRIVEYHAPSSDPSIPPYGVSFIFFTACAGAIDLTPAWKNIDLGSGAQLRDAVLGFPFACYDANGTQLGPDDFVSGYTEEFVYRDGSTNNNPVILADENTTAKTEMQFDGKDVNPDAYCIDGACVDSQGGSATPPMVPTAAACTSDTKKLFPHVPKCSGKCPTYDFKPTLDPDKNNDDTRFGPPNQPGVPKPEQMWINYYSDKGTLKHTVRLLRDADNGWAPNPYNSTWTPPSDSGPVNFWTVVHDVRGGTSWIRLVVCVDD